MFVVCFSMFASYIQVHFRLDFYREANIVHIFCNIGYADVRAESNSRYWRAKLI